MMGQEHGSHFMFSAAPPGPWHPGQCILFTSLSLLPFAEVGLSHSTAILGRQPFSTSSVHCISFCASPSRSGQFSLRSPWLSVPPSYRRRPLSRNQLPVPVLFFFRYSFRILSFCSMRSSRIYTIPDARIPWFPGQHS